MILINSSIYTTFVYKVLVLSKKAKMGVKTNSGGKTVINRQLYLLNLNLSIDETCNVKVLSSFLPSFYHGLIKK